MSKRSNAHLRGACVQRMNHFSGMLELCRKKSLAKHFAAAAAVLPAAFDFCPKTYLVPEQLADLRAELKHAPAAPCKRRAWIIKPDAGCQGRGIALAQTAKHLAQVRRRAAARTVQRDPCGCEAGACARAQVTAWPACTH